MVKTRFTRQSLAAGAALVIAVAGGAWFLSSNNPSEDATQAEQPDPATITNEQMQRLGIRLQPAKRAETELVGTLPGIVSLPPDARVAVTTLFAGTVAKVLVIQGQRVRAGEPLAVVRTAETIQFGGELARAQADLAVSRAAASRLETLAREGVVAVSRAEEARAQLQRTEATLRENRRLLSIGGGSTDGTVVLRAPISGRVASVAVEAGVATGGGGPAPFVVENDSKLSLDLQIPERLAGRIRPGMTVEVASTESNGQPLKGRIVSVAGSLDPVTRSIPAKAVLDDGATLSPGKSIMAVVAGADSGEDFGVSVPSGAVAKIEGRDYVFMRSGPKFIRRPVQVLGEAGGRTIIADGLRVGETVAVSGIAELKSLTAEQ